MKCKVLKWPRRLMEVRRRVKGGKDQSAIGISFQKSLQRGTPRTHNCFQMLPRHRRVDFGMKAEGGLRWKRVKVRQSGISFRALSSKWRRGKITGKSPQLQHGRGDSADPEPSLTLPIWLFAQFRPFFSHFLAQFVQINLLTCLVDRFCNMFT